MDNETHGDSGYGAMPPQARPGERLVPVARLPDGRVLAVRVAAGPGGAAAARRVAARLAGGGGGGDDDGDGAMDHPPPQQSRRQGRMPPQRGANGTNALRRSLARLRGVTKRRSGSGRNAGAVEDPKGRRDRERLRVERAYAELMRKPGAEQNKPARVWRLRLDEDGLSARLKLDPAASKTGKLDMAPTWGSGDGIVDAVDGAPALLLSARGRIASLSTNGDLSDVQLSTSDGETVVQVALTERFVVVVTTRGRALAAPLVHASQSATHEVPTPEAVISVVATRDFACLLGVSGRVFRVSSAELRKNPRAATAYECKGHLKNVCVRALAAGPTHCVALSGSGAVYGLGSNAERQLRDEGDVGQLAEWEKLETPGGGQACAVACGDAFTALLMAGSGAVAIISGGLVDVVDAFRHGDVQRIAAAADVLAVVKKDGAALALAVPAPPSSSEKTLKMREFPKPEPVPASKGASAMRVRVLGGHVLLIPGAAFADADASGKARLGVRQAALTATQLLELAQRSGTEARDALESMLTEPATLGGSFLRDRDASDDGSSGVNLDAAREALLRALAAALREGSDAKKQRATVAGWLGLCAKELAESAHAVMCPDQLRPIFVFLASPLAKTAPEQALALIEACDALQRHMVDLLFVWIQADVPGDMLAELLVQPIVKAVDSSLFEDGGAGLLGVDMAAQRRLRVLCRFLWRLWRVNEERVVSAMRLGGASDGGSMRASGTLASRRRASHTFKPMHPPAPRKAFHLRALDEISDDALNEYLGAWMLGRGSRPRPFHLLDYAFLLDAEVKKRVLGLEGRGLQYLRMQGEVSQGRRHARDLYFVLELDRADLLNSAVQALGTASTSDYTKPLLVVFKGEEGQDAGGVRKEAFQLLADEVFRLDGNESGMFVPHPGAEDQLWFNTRVDRNLIGDYLPFYDLVGAVLGLAVYNNVILDIHMPLAFYRLLLGKLPSEGPERPGPGLEHLAELDASLARQLNYLQACDDQTLKSMDLYFTGVHDMPLCPDGENKQVTAQNVDDFVAKRCEDELRGSAQPQLDTLLRGFSKIINPNFATFGLLQPDELQLIICGDPSFDVAALRASTRYVGGYYPDHPVIQRFWRVVEALQPEQQRELLRFSTGAPRVPVGGVEALEFTVQRAGVDSEQLPTASTCFNVLILPPYGTEEKLRAKLLLAIENAQGFGLA